MSEAKEYLVQPVDKGTVNISEEVVAAIAALAISDVEGVYGLSSSFTADLAELLGRKNMAKGVKLTIDNEVVTVECFVVIAYGSDIPAVAANIQDAVITAVESMTGLKVAAVTWIFAVFAIPRTKCKPPLSIWTAGIYLF